MEFIFNPDIDKIVIESLYKTLSIHLLNGEYVVWIVSGGSAIATAVAVAQKLHGRDLSRLSVTLADERFGPVDHDNENWKALLDAGLIIKKATVYRPLQGKSRTETTQEFAAWLEKHLTAATFSIGLFGMGKDGHTAGILPESTATSAGGWATDYVGPDFERITMTFDAITQLDEVIVQIKGAEKKQQMVALRDTTLNRVIQPAQVLKDVKKSTLFTDIREITS